MIGPLFTNRQLTPGNLSFPGVTFTTEITQIVAPAGGAFPEVRGNNKGDFALTRNKNGILAARMTFSKPLAFSINEDESLSGNTHVKDRWKLTIGSGQYELFDPGTQDISVISSTPTELYFDVIGGDNDWRISMEDVSVIDAEFTALSNDNTSILSFNTCYGGDFSDAGAGYSAASHTTIPGIQLGATVTEEGSQVADADDLSDDGILAFPALTVGDSSYTIPALDIVASGTGTLHAWIDFDNNKSFDSGEHTSVSVVNGALAGDLTWAAINTAMQTGNTYARFRLTSDSTVSASTPGSAAVDGEVEDYLVAIVPAPTDAGTGSTCTSASPLTFANFNTAAVPMSGELQAGGIKVADVSVHVPGTVSHAKTAVLDGGGRLAIGSYSGSPSDNLANGFYSVSVTPIPGATINPGAFLWSGKARTQNNATNFSGSNNYSDFSVDGSGHIASVVVTQDTTDQDYLPTLSVGDGLLLGNTYASDPGTKSFANAPAFELSVNTNTIPTGETFVLEFQKHEETPINTSLAHENHDLIASVSGCVPANPDRSDAPADGSTGPDGGTTAYGEATHGLDATIRLGATITADTSSVEDADDASDDGLVFNGNSSINLINASVENATSNSLEVTPSTAGFFNLWIDYNANGTFEASEQVFNDTPVTAGAQSLTYVAPSDPVPGQTYARARFSSTAGQANTATGAALDGEVEDYSVVIHRAAEPLSCDADGTVFSSLDFRYFERVSSTVHRAKNVGALPDGTVLDLEISSSTGITWDGTQTVPGTPVIEIAGVANTASNITMNLFEAGTTTPATGNFVFQFQDLDGDNLDNNPADGVGDSAPSMPITTYSVSNEYQHFYNIHDFELGGDTRLYEDATSNSPSDLFLQSTASNNYDGSLSPSQLATRVAWKNVSQIQYSYFGGQFGGGVTDGQGIDTSGFAASCANSDYSDAPASYGDADHTVTAGIQLGAAIDVDTASIATTNADGDGADDDGVSLPAITPGGTGTITVSVAQNSANQGFLQGWIDWNGDGDFFDTGEQVATDLQSASAGNSTINVPFTAPGTATNSPTFARFRWSSISGVGSNGSAPDGEVEDYALNIYPAFSCSPTLYQVYGSSGNIAEVDIINSTYNALPNSPANFRLAGMGYRVSDNLAYGLKPNGELLLIDATGATTELGAVSGLPTATNFNTASFGGDGYLHVRRSSQDTVYRINVDTRAVVGTYTLTPNIDAAADFAYSPADGMFYAATNGGYELHSINPATGATALIGTLSPSPGSSGFGAVYSDVEGRLYGIQNTTGDVYQIDTSTAKSVIIGTAAPSTINDGFSCHNAVVAFPDHSDAPADGSTAPNGTAGATAYGEATHIIQPGLFLGTAIDYDHNAITSTNADGDGADDDGVSFPALVPGDSGTITVSVSGAGFLQGWIDWNGNGVFDSPTEQIAEDLQDFGTGMISIPVTVPTDAITTQTFARFRWSSDYGIGPDGAAPDGEVEDYALTFGATGPVLSGTVFIDNGTGGGSAHDAVINGSETVSQSASVSLYDSTGTLIAMPPVNADGTWSYTLPTGFNAPVTVTATPQPGWITISEQTAGLPSLVNSDAHDGSYTFTPSASGVYSALDIGLIEEPRLTQNQTSSIAAGQIVDDLMHDYIATSSANVTFSIVDPLMNPEGTFSVTLFEDTNCDGILNNAITAPRAVTAGERVCLISRVATSSGVGPGAQLSYGITAVSAFTATTKSSTARNDDVVGAGTGGDQLTLRKTVRNVTKNTTEGTANVGDIGDVLEYRLILSNPSGQPATNVTVNDRTPAYTALTGPIASPITVAPGISCSLAVPVNNTAGYAGPLEWTCPGTFPPGELGSLSFQVTISP